MPNRAQRRNSVVDLLAKVPVNRGSLLKSIENLLKTIESSESAVMIPTLLRDKCDFDAWELLFVAKILKASILGHSDLVEFYMNYIGHSTNHLQAVASAVTSNNQNCFSSNTNLSNNSNNTEQQQQLSASLSPSTIRLQFSPIPSSPSNNISATEQQQQQQQQQGKTTNLPPQQSSSANNLSQQPTGFTSLSPPSSISSVTTTATNGGANSTTLTSNNKSSSSLTTNNSWTTANSGNNQQQQNSEQQTTSYSSCNSSAGSSLNNEPFQQDSSATSTPTTPTTTTITSTTALNFQQQQQQMLEQVEPLQQAISAASMRPMIGGSGGRQAQPPSLLQLTTNNNHINSMAAVAAGLSSSNVEQLTNKLNSMQANFNTAEQNPAPMCPMASTNATSPSTLLSSSSSPINGLAPGSGLLDGALSISTTNNNQQLPINSNTNGNANSNTGPSQLLRAVSTTPSSVITNGNSCGGMRTTPATGPATATTINGIKMEATSELRTSRSAGCLFRLNSGASSPRTPCLQTPTNTTTPAPYPQAETLAKGLANGLRGDPSAPVKLLLQIEQLKSSITHVTNLLESVVELYKKSIDNIALA